MRTSQRPARLVRASCWALVAVLAGACGGAGSPATTPEAAPSATPAAEPTPPAEPRELTLATGVPGAGEIALASDGEGFLAVYVSEDGDPGPSVLAHRLSPVGEPRDPQPILLGSNADLEAEYPGRFARFTDLRAAFDGSSYQVLWLASRSVEILDETRIWARAVEPMGPPLGPLATLYYDLAMNRVCNGLTSGPLALGRRGADLLLFWARGIDCLRGYAGPGEVHVELSRLAGGALSSIGIEPLLLVNTFETADALLRSSAALAGREQDALVTFVPERVFNIFGELLGVWLAGEQATLLELAGVAAVPAVASDGAGYLVVWRSPAAGGGDELRAARFLTDEQRLDDPAGTVLATGSGIDRPRLVALGPGRYLLAHVEAAPEGGASLVASRVETAGTLRVTSRQVLGGGDEILGLELARSGSLTLALVARGDGAESFELRVHPVR